MTTRPDIEPHLAVVLHMPEKKRKWHVRYTSDKNRTVCGWSIFSHLGWKVDGNEIFSRYVWIANLMARAEACKNCTNWLQYRGYVNGKDIQMGGMNI
jgi:hypothetical protein